MKTFALIGAGGVLKRHVSALEQLPGRIVALVDPDPSVAEPCARRLACPSYQDYQTMLQEMQPEVAVILTPPFLHAPLALACLQAGCHVLVEKPMALSIKEADEMIATAQAQRRLLGVVFQQRFRAEVLATKRLLEKGYLGQLQYLNLVVTCPRPGAYYQASNWRGTWAGEGGGVVMNQAPHALDLLCYLVGMPGRLVAWTHRQLHHMEAEDTVQAMLEWPAGAIGSLAASTAWASGEVAEPASEQCTLHLIGTAGSFRLANGRLSVTRLKKDMRAFANEALQPFPTSSPCAVPLPQSDGTHLSVYRHFCAALDSQPSQVITGTEARQSLELANGLLLSGQTGKQVAFPLNREQYASFLAEQQRACRPPLLAS